MRGGHARADPAAAMAERLLPSSGERGLGRGCAQRRPSLRPPLPPPCGTCGRRDALRERRRRRSGESGGTGRGGSAPERAWDRGVVPGVPSSPLDLHPRAERMGPRGTRLEPGQKWLLRAALARPGGGGSGGRGGSESRCAPPVLGVARAGPAAIAVTREPGEGVGVAVLAGTQRALERAQEGQEKGNKCCEDQH